MMMVCALAGCGALIGIDDPEIVDPPSGNSSSSSSSSSGGGASSSSSSSSSSSGELDIIFNGALPFDYTAPVDADGEPGHMGVLVTGTSCLNSGCHSASDSKPFTAAGTVQLNGAGVAAQIGIRGFDSFASTYTDRNGNFWIRALLSDSNRVGIRTAQTPTVVMSAPVGNIANCNDSSCHGTSGMGIRP